MSATAPIPLRIIDDDGLIAIVDASAYATFVDPDWTYEQLLDHFAAEMAKGTILVWDCGDGGGDYRVEVRTGFTDTPGFRSAIGWLNVGDGALHVASYTALTMAAQFEDYGIPAEAEAEEVFDVPWRSVRVRIVQMYDPGASQDPPGPHVVVEVEPGDAPPLPGVLWEAVSGPASPGQDESAPPSPARRPGFFSKLFRRP